MAENSFTSMLFFSAYDQGVEGSLQRGCVIFSAHNDSSLFGFALKDAAEEVDYGGDVDGDSDDVWPHSQVSG